MKKLLFIALAFGLLLSANVALAQTAQDPFCTGGKCTYVPLEPLPGVTQTGDFNFPLFLAGMFKLLISIGALFAVVMLVIAGIGYMLSESPVDLDKAKDRAKAALLGLLLLSTSWLILFTINPNLLRFDLFTSAIKSTGTPSGSAVSTLQSSASTASLNAQLKDCASRGGTIRSNPDNTQSCYNSYDR